MEEGIIGTGQFLFDHNGPSVSSPRIQRATGVVKGYSPCRFSFDFFWRTPPYGMNGDRMKELSFAAKRSAVLCGGTMLEGKDKGAALGDWANEDEAFSLLVQTVGGRGVAGHRWHGPMMAGGRYAFEDAPPVLFR